MPVLGKIIHTSTRVLHMSQRKTFLLYPAESIKNGFNEDAFDTASTTNQDSEEDYGFFGPMDFEVIPPQKPIKPTPSSTPTPNNIPQSTATPSPSMAAKSIFVPIQTHTTPLRSESRAKHQSVPTEKTQPSAQETRQQRSNSAPANPSPHRQIGFHVPYATLLQNQQKQQQAPSVSNEQNLSEKKLSSKSQYPSLCMT
jgi:hypothetical protein